VRFRCKNCGRQVSVASTYAGKKGRCPKCGKVVAIPAPRVEETTSSQPEDKSLLHDALLLDVPRVEPSAPAVAVESDAETAYQALQALQGGRLLRRDDEAPRRKLPWPIDIFLYPLNRAGLTVLILSAGLPFLVRAILRFFMYFSAVFPPMLVFWVMFIVFHWFALALSLLYMNWYVCACIRDSATGGIRATDTTASTPGLGELLGQSVVVIAGAAVCLAPALIYLNHTRSLDRLFWVLYGVGGFFFPMTLLAIVMFEGLRALNPLLVVGSILSTFLRYCVLVPFCYVLCLLIPVVGRYLFTPSWALAYALLFLAFYQLLVLAHLLGRFYWNNQERLNWDA
jgi:phage FluMu protein Com